MVLKNGNERLTIELSIPTGVYRRENKHGWSETRTHRKVRRTAECFVFVELDEAKLAGLVRKAYRNRSHKAVDGPITVKMREISRVSEVDVPCSRCSRVHDFGIPCAEAGDGTNGLKGGRR